MPFFSLNADTVELWVDDLSNKDLQQQLDSIALSSEERGKAQSFYFTQHRNGYALAHKYLRLVFSFYVETKPDLLVFSKSEHGKPAILAAQNTLNIQFNLSHSGNLIAVAVGKKHPLGVDIEIIEPTTNIDTLAAHCFSPAELLQLRALPYPDRNRIFYRHWSKKEAYLKALGKGLTVEPNSFSIDVLQSNSPVIVKNSQESVSSWKLWAITTFEQQQCACALASLNAIVTVHSKSLLQTNHSISTKAAP